ncbi:MAG: NRDE family protein, partial [Planctomycetota bacterium]
GSRCTMCLAIISFGSTPGWPVFVAANRDEDYRRPSEPPRCDEVAGVMRLAPRDLRAGGTWIGVNDHGVFALITNRSDLPLPRGKPRSRGLLLLDLLGRPGLDAALELLERAPEPVSAPYNLVVGDGGRLFAIEKEGCEALRIEALPPGLHVVTNLGPSRDTEIPEAARARELWQEAAAASEEPFRAAARVLRDRGGGGAPPLCRHLGDRGTVSSTLLGLGDGGEIAFEHAAGPPCVAPYEPVRLLERIRQ